MKLLGWTSSLLAVLILVACGSSGDETTTNSTAETPAEMDIAAVIDKYEIATKQHDADLLCTEVLPNESNPANGEDPKKCPVIIGAAMKDSTSELSKALTIKVTSYEVKGSNATVKATLNGKPQNLQFTDGENGWRLAALG